MCSSFEPSLAQQTQLELIARKTINNSRTNPRIKVHVVLRFFRSLMSSSTRTARQNKFVLIYIVELSKPYRMVFETWESVQAKQIVPLFTRVYFFRVCKTLAAKQLPRSSWTSPDYKSNTTEQQKSSSFC